MIADEVATDICSRFVTPSSLVLDPFCGTGRTLVAAAELGADTVGLDVNPLALLLVRAKMANVKYSRLLHLVADIKSAPPVLKAQDILELEGGRKVKWFPKSVKIDLCNLIVWINNYKLSKSELILVIAVLSATIRDVSYCRKDQWKLHRLSASKRSSFRTSVVKVFTERLQSVLSELLKRGPSPGACRVIHGNCMQLRKTLASKCLPVKYDLVFTSPPYGDSYTTVQYGGVSSLCLGVLRHIDGLRVKADSIHNIDNRCLGGRMHGNTDVHLAQVTPFWRGNDVSNGKARISRFLYDLQICAKNISSVLKVGGRAIFVVARRNVGGSELKLDKFLESVMSQSGCILESQYIRDIKGKITPYVINTNIKTRARTNANMKCNRVKTMRREYVIIFKKKQ
jgi:site-specific DNA-methyltransferase (cytosine-N4-specific)